MRKKFFKYWIFFQTIFINKSDVMGQKIKFLFVEQRKLTTKEKVRTHLCPKQFALLPFWRSNNLDYTFSATVYQSLISVEESFPHSSTQICVSSEMFEECLTFTTSFKSPHSISIRWKTERSEVWRYHFRSKNLFFHPFLGGFTGMFWVILMLHGPHRC